MCRARGGSSGLCTATGDYFEESDGLAFALRAHVRLRGPGELEAALVAAESLHLKEACGKVRHCTATVALV